MVGRRKKTPASIAAVSTAKCGKCNDPVLTEDEEEDIECTLCKKWYHAMCCNLSPAEFRKATEESSSPFTCYDCIRQRNLTSNHHHSEYSVILEKLKVLDILPGMEKSLSYLSEKYDQLLSDQNQLRSSFNKLKRENELIREELSFLQSKQRLCDNDRTKCACIFTRVPGISDANFKPKEAVIKICEAIDVPVVEREIESAFIRKSRDASKNQQSLVVKFCSLGVKRDLMYSKKKLAGTTFKEVKIFDQLSEEKLKLYNHAINLRKTGYKYLYHQKGRIYVKREETSRPILITSMDHVDHLLAELDGSKRTSQRYSTGIAAHDAS